MEDGEPGVSKLVFKVNLRRVGDNVVEATGGTDGRIVMGPKGTPNSFTPVELLLAAIAGCLGMDLCTLSERDEIEIGDFELRMRGVKPMSAKQLESVSVAYEAPDGEPAEVERLVAEVSELCTVALTVRDGCHVVEHKVVQAAKAS